jgi:hypothetical protein
VSCESRRDAILLLGAGLLDGEEADELRAHLRTGCPECAEHVAEARDLDRLLLEATPSVAPDPELRARLLRRVGRAPAAPSRGPGRRLAPLALAAAIGAVLAGVPAWLLARRAGDARVAEIAALRDATLSERDELRSERDELREELERTDDEMLESEEELQASRDQVAMLRAPGLQVLDLVGTAAQPKAHARVFWNWEDYLCYLHATGLEAPAEGSVYALWLDTAARGRVLAGTFRPERGGVATLWVQLPRDSGEARGAEITLEAAEPEGEPAGPVQLIPAPS